MSFLANLFDKLLVCNELLTFTAAHSWSSGPKPKTTHAQGARPCHLSSLPPEYVRPCWLTSKPESARPYRRTSKPESARPCRLATKPSRFYCLAPIKSTEWRFLPDILRSCRFAEFKRARCFKSSVSYTTWFDCFNRFSCLFSTSFRAIAGLIVFDALR